MTTAGIVYLAIIGVGIALSRKHMHTWKRTGFISRTITDLETNQIQTCSAYVKFECQYCNKTRTVLQTYNPWTYDKPKNKHLGSGQVFDDVKEMTKAQQS